MKNFLFFIICFISLGNLTSFSQRKLKFDKKELLKSKGKFNMNPNDSLNNSSEIKVKLSGKTKYTDYRIISHQNDTIYIDTTLNIKKHYTFNFLRKDNFELLPFQNQGQTFTKLGYDFSKLSRFPDIGFTAKQFGLIKLEDINYYEVPTPTTEILYRTGLEQGQVLETLFTLNFSKRLNVSIAYKGLRSLGQYRRSLVSLGNFRTTFHYKTINNKYSAKGHIATFDHLGQENGGLTPTALTAFTTDDPDFKERGRLDVNLNDTENTFKGSRFYFEHDYKLFAKKDTVHHTDFSNLKIGHVFTSENKKYTFNETLATPFLGAASTANTAINESVENTITNNQVFIEFNSKYVLGTFRARADYTKYSYGYDTIYNANLHTINKIKLAGNSASVGADWKAKIKNFQLNASATITPGQARLSGSDFRGEMRYKKDSLFTIKARILINSKLPNFNFLLFQSTYNDYNWQNNFSNVNTRNIGGSIDTKWGNASVDLSNINNYTYFDSNNKPQQAGVNITYLKVKISNEFTLGKFALNNTFMYQNVSSGSTVFRVPELVTRNTFYYSVYWFKGKPLQVQIGATFNYFTKYKANAYNPLLADFTLQNTTEIGYPTINVFFNAQVRRTRVYFKADNISSLFLQKNYFSAPNYPFRDFVIRFGLVWNWFI